MNIEKAISKVVRHKMLSRDLNVKLMAKAAGLCAQTVSNQLNERTEWGVNRLCKFASILDTSASEIMAEAEKLQSQDKT